MSFRFFKTLLFLELGTLYVLFPLLDLPEFSP